MNATADNHKKTYDVIIVGGGVVGLTLAALLAQQGVLQIALIDSQTLDPNFSLEKYDLRVSAMTRASERILQSLGVWRPIIKTRAASYHAIQVWEQGQMGAVNFSYQDVGEPNLGHIVENNLMTTELIHLLKTQSNVTFYPERHLQTLHIESEYAQMVLEDGTALQTRLLVGADGGNSWIRKTAHFAVEERDYQHLALAALVETELPHEFIARQCFFTNEHGSGTLAFLPLADPHQCWVGWATQPEKMRELLALDEDAFCRELTTCFDYRLAKVSKVFQRQTFPLIMRHAKDYVKPRVALVGDAAHTLHFMAGQGLNLGILDAAALAEVIDAAVQQGGDVGDERVLKRYQRWRKGQNTTMIKAMEGLKFLFSAQATPIRWLRNVGLNATDRCFPLKHFFIRQAMGLSGDLPKMARSAQEEIG